MNILITGGTGLIGRALCRRLAEAGHTLTVLSRQPAASVAALLPAGVSVVASLDDVAADARIDAIINLAGEGIADRRWSEARKQVLLDSRVAVTQAIDRLVERLVRKPQVLLSGSAVGFYGDSGDREVDEFSPAASRDFPYLLCDAWERAARAISRHGVRVCIIRIGVVLAADGGMMGRLLPAYRLALGARLGSGRQWFSWIHRDDLVALLVFLLDKPQVHGVFNGVAPQPVTQRRFHQTLARVCHRPAPLVMPAWPLRLALGEMSALLLEGQRVLPVRTREAGFVFRFAELEEALKAVVASPGNAGSGE